MSSSEKPRQLASFDLGRLQEHSRSCSNATNEILRSHVRFALLMAERIDGASRPQSTLNYDSSETTRLANNIKASAESLSEYVTKMKDDLDSFMSDLEEVQVMLKKELLVQVAAKKEPSVPGAAKKESWLEWILGLLKSLFNAIVRFLRLATACIPIPTSLRSTEPRRRPVSALKQGAANICTANSGAFLEPMIPLCKSRSDRLLNAELQERKESESLESLILYFKKIVPREAKNAKKKLERFDVALDTMGLERHMKEGRRVILFGPDPAAVAKKWRDIAEKYQSMLPDNKGPTS